MPPPPPQWDRLHISVRWIFGWLENIVSIFNWMLVSHNLQLLIYLENAFYSFGNIFGGNETKSGYVQFVPVILSNVPAHTTFIEKWVKVKWSVCMFEGLSIIRSCLHKIIQSAPLCPPPHLPYLMFEGFQCHTAMGIWMLSTIYKNITFSSNK